MKKLGPSLKKDYIREIKNSKARFFSIFSLVALGAFVLVGLTVSGPIIRKSLEAYIDQSHTYDIALSVADSLEDKDRALLGQLGGKDREEYIRTIELKDQEEGLNFKLKGLPKSLSLPQVSQGRLPEARGEILLDQDLEGRGFKLGQTISFDREVDKYDPEAEARLSLYQYKVVGFGRSIDFLDQSSKGLSKNGGNLDAFAYILPEDFADPTYQEYYVSFKDLREGDTWTASYEKKVQAHLTQMEALLRDRPQERYQANLAEFRDKIQEGKDKVQEGKEDLEEGRQDLEEAQAKLAKADKDLSQAKSRLNSGLASGRHKLNQSKSQLTQAKEDLAQKEAALSQGQTSLEEGKKALEAQAQKLQAEEEALQANKAQLEAGLGQVEAKIQDLSQQMGTGPDQDPGLAQALASLEGERAQLMGQKAALAQGQEKINQGRAQLAQAQEDLKAKEGDLAQGRLALEEGKKKIEEGQAQLIKGQGDLAKKERESRAKISQAQRDLNKGRADYQEGKEEYDRLYPQALEDIAQGEEDLEKAEGVLSVLKKPAYNLTPRSETLTLYTVFDYAVRLDNLAKIFPVFFFAVAMLLCATTMNRMVDEEKISIGTYKALGYSNRPIAGKYVFYGGLAASLGGIVGALGGNYYLSQLIAKAYTTGYAIPRLIVDFHPWQNILALLVGILATSLVAYLTVASSLAQNASALMRPKAPKQGSRILLERIGPLWRSLSFLQKVTARNIFRYKKRMAMTLIGVMGCVALLVLGFGIQTSVDGLVEKQFDQLTRFDLIVLHERALDKKAYQDFRKTLDGDKRIGTYLDGRLESVKVKYPKGIDQKAMVIVPSSKEDLKTLVTLRDRETKKAIGLEDSGLVVTEKLALLLGLRVGDKLSFTPDQGREISMPIGAITEGYAGHYIYMSKEAYGQAFQRDFSQNMTLVKIRPEAQDQAQKISEELTENQAVLSALDLSGIQNLVGQLSSSIGQIVLVIIFASSLLAIVVLFTLTNINIHERKRELSTIKVLGFYPGEVTAYVYRETGSLTLIGILLGFVVGKVLHNQVMRMVVPDQAMLDPSLTWINYAIPGGITLVISLVVCLIVHRSLKRIDMVEALKAVE